MRALVVAKAPVPGRVKTRLGARRRHGGGRRLAAAALLDTLAACRAAFDRVPSRARRRPRRRRPRRRLCGAPSTGWIVHPQRGDGLGERLAHAHADAAGPARPSRSAWTPRSSRRRPARGRATAASDGDAVLGPPTDGGWWVLALSDPSAAAVLADVPMSRPTPSPTPAAPCSRPDRPSASGPSSPTSTPSTRRRGSPAPDRRPLPPGLARGDRMTTLPLASVYTHALQGHPCTVWEGDLAPQPLPTHAWLARADAADLALLAHCQGPTLDIGCGPGRMTEALALAGHAVLGIDVVPEAVRQTRARGVPALRRSVFDPLPGEGRWETALLADGNIGIGGDPVALLERARELVATRTAGSSSTSHRGAPAWSPDTSGSRPPTAGAGSSRGRPSAPTPSRPWRTPPGWAARPSTGTATAGGPCSRPGREDRDPPPRSRRARLHLLAAQPRGHGPGRALARHLLRPRLRHRADQPLGPDAVAVAPVPDQPELGLPGHPGPARHRRHRGGAAAAGQALDRLPEAVRPAAEGGPGARRCTGSSGSRSRCWSPRRSSSSSPGWRTPRSGTPGTSTSAPPTTRSPGSRSARSSCTSRSSCRSSGPP